MQALSVPLGASWRVGTVRRLLCLVVDRSILDILAVAITWPVKCSTRLATEKRGISGGLSAFVLWAVMRGKNTIKNVRHGCRARDQSQLHLSVHKNGIWSFTPNENWPNNKTYSLPKNPNYQVEFVMLQHANCENNAPKCCMFLG